LSNHSLSCDTCELLEFTNENFEKVVEATPAIGAKVYRGMAEVLANRLASNDETLMDTIFWALGRSINRTPASTSTSPTGPSSSSSSSERDNAGSLPDLKTVHRR